MHLWVEEGFVPVCSDFMSKGLLFKTVMLICILVIALVVLIVIMQTSMKPGSEALACQTRLKEGCLDYLTDGGCRLESSLRPVSDGYVSGLDANCSIGTDKDETIKEHCCKINPR
jgi:hypothetical protein